ncbi:UbiA family prenyltransferase [Roseibacterium sp. SDUM158017]|uniref:UbiA family prenyltransferase n=1 Tax=Roseicyclus salinarum TaxID=3036773 RepID=UPI0024154A48|nr:UbiA family prenyltransferase [Roseibacterium sp. SDUM158017]MDG4650559.1 UbiA family prenyltransferase [Roseibacterium sp. SDUM158017]
MPPVLPIADDDCSHAGAAPEAGRVLAVDLDGTLVRTDMLHETLWGALSARNLALSDALRALSRGPAALKAALADRVTVDPASLPYDARVLARIEAWRAAGGRVALVTASDARVAASVAAHLGIFDAVHGSTPERNLKGRAKADLLVSEYGAGGFAYIGDSTADLPVWAQADEAIAIEGASGLRGAVDARGRPAERITSEGGDLRALVRTLRPHQWLKNLLVFVPILADPSHGGWLFTWVLAAFFAMSFAASAGYVINDLLDLADDRSHPRKRNRPFASGALSAATGTWLAPALLILSLGVAAMISLKLVAVVVAYFLLTMSYSLSLKRHAVIDICTLAALYTIRIVAGGVAIGVSLSVWLLAFSMFVFFSLAAAKRLGELSDADAAGRTISRRGYTVDDRRILSQMAISAGYIGVLVLALYIDEPYVQERFGAHRMFWGVCALLIFWISRLVLVANRGEMDDDPLIWSFTDGVSRLTVAAIAALMAIAVLW